MELEKRCGQLVQQNECFIVGLLCQCDGVAGIDAGLPMAFGPGLSQKKDRGHETESQVMWTLCRTLLLAHRSEVSPCEGLGLMKTEAERPVGERVQQPFEGRPG